MADEPKRDQHGRYAVTEAELEERRAKVIKLRVDGYGFREIAAKLQMSVGQAYNDFKAVMDRTKAEADSTAEQERQVSLARIDRAMSVLMPLVDEGSLDAMDRLDKLEKRRAALLGLDAPTRQEHTGAGGAPIEIDARGALLERLAGLADSEAATSEETSDPREPE